MFVGVLVYNVNAYRNVFASIMEAFENIYFKLCIIKVGAIYVKAFAINETFRPRNKISLMEIIIQRAKQSTITETLYFSKLINFDGILNR